MPTYEYECQKCGHRFEQFQNIQDPLLKACPTCGSPVRRLLGAGAAVIFKGSGFHKTDYAQPRTRCGQERPCCGRDTPCDTPRCND